MFNHFLIVLYVADIERSVRLYRNSFGMTESYRFPREGTPEHVELKLGTDTIGLSTDAGLKRHGMPPATRGQPFELAFRTDDTDASLRELEAAGCRVIKEPFDTEAGNRVAYLEDFDGNRISIYSPIRSPA